MKKGVDISGTKEGGKKAAETTLKRHGDDYYSNLGRLGGKVRCEKGFATNRELAREASLKGLQTRWRNRARTNESKVERDE